MSSRGSDSKAEDTKVYGNELLFLTLGDGDFTWSLDLGRHLASTESFRHHHVSLIATGIDSLDVLSKKYRDANHTIREIKRLNDSPSNPIQAEVFHEVNAIVHLDPSTSSNRNGHIVIFNHPHLGTENAQLHGKFLSHLFHSVTNYWLKPSGVFYLTLANGQYERWKCCDAALRNGMELVERTVFISAPSLILSPVYEHRRHQSGKSFASRTLGSETFTFARYSDTENRSLRSIRLPWFSSESEESMNLQPKAQRSFECSFCGKAFAEDRSLRNHVTSVHSQRKRGRSDMENPITPEAFTCIQCSIRSSGRCFSSLEALQDHVRAKHDGIHDKISPDWKSSPISSPDISPVLRENFGSCEICQHQFEYPDDEKLHLKMFLPSDDEAELGLFQCSFCLRTFRQHRSKLQHENFCSSRGQTTDCRETAHIQEIS